VPGQINFSILYPGVVKAWHRHKRQTDYFCVIIGDARVAMHDPEKGTTETIFIGEHNPKVLKIPLGIWHGYTALGPTPCGLLYYVDRKYDPKDPDEERAPWDSFGYNWFPENK
jgi:dTDP-4-dehydrorhamnose 3,5-epimerase